jgi:serine protease Do
MSTPLRRAGFAAAVLGAAAAAFLIGRVIDPEAAAAAPPPSFAAGPSSGPGEAAAAALAGAPDFRDVARKVVPSVVTVRSQKTVRAGRNPFAPGDPFGDDFFERFFGMPRRGDPREDRYVERGLGSGVVVSADGYILTNNHVVGGGDTKVNVVTEDGKTYTAKILGTDPQTDIAVLKVEASGLRPIPMGDSASLEVGEWVLAVGNPFSEALGHTVTAGIVSAKGRSNLNLADYEDFIQTDAAINPGNSGGALVNTRGQLVGINTAIVSRSGGYQGVGFAIPVNMARNVMDQLVKNGKVVRGWIGISIQDFTPELAEGMGLEGKEGAIVAEVVPDSPAMEAGLKQGDVIVAVDGRKVASNTELRNRISATSPGTKVTLTLIRDGKERSVDLTLGELPGSAAASGGGEEPAEESLGLSVRALTPEVAARLGYEDDQGVVVWEVEVGSPAGEAGLQRGDLIKEVNRRRVTSLADYRQAVGSIQQGKVVLLLVRRGERATYVTLRP